MLEDDKDRSAPSITQCSACSASSVRRGLSIIVSGAAQGSVIHAGNSARAVGLLDDKVDIARMVQPAHHHNAFARTRMLGVLDQNVKGLFLGGMSPSRRAP